MIAIYRGKKYNVSKGLSNNDWIVLTSDTKDEGFNNYVDSWGEEFDDFFSKKSQDGRARLSIQYSL